MRVPVALSKVSVQFTHKGTCVTGATRCRPMCQEPGRKRTSYLPAVGCVCASVHLGAGLGEASVAQYSCKQVWKGLYAD
ncbi:hypothetical protein PAL_GLEAN10018135 [Pteropus alecto]|uniref:Uncharacterized protein n=1 Tax=Pteropus alecto TaxID=9402 RepID=L5KXG4_PTEAL|nr:hypothetical protein PAL_GLEAN10018135 [Pteropus alecto]